ncbi:MAG: DUF4231 domain-containing protein [Leptolyngbyaceae cyanobacterium]
MTQQFSDQSTPVAQQDLSYDKQLKNSFTQVIQSLALEERQKLFLEHRWLEQILWMEKKTKVCRDRHTRLKLTAIVLSVITPILVGATTFFPPEQEKLEYWFKLGTLGVSGIVAIAGSVDEFFNYGQRWYDYRQAVESLKSEGWQFFELTGSYLPCKSHKEAFASFASQVEETIRRDVNLFATQQQNKEEDSSKSQTTDSEGNSTSS